MSTIFSINRSERPERARPNELEIELDGQCYPVRVRKLAQARSIAVSADTISGEVRLSMPRYASTAQALRFAQSKSDWLAKCFAEALPAIPIIDGAEIAFAGEPHMVRWDPAHPRKPVRIDGEIRLGGPLDRVADRTIRWMKEEARASYALDLEDYCDRANLERPVLSIGDARRRWGSCSGRRAIRMSWRLIMAPPLVRRSVVAHEVAHLRHMDHSKAFYGLLDDIFEGDRKTADRWLKQHGAALHLVGIEKI